MSKFSPPFIRCGPLDAARRIGPGHPSAYAEGRHGPRSGAGCAAFVGGGHDDSGLVRGTFIWPRIWFRRSSWKVMFMFIDLMARAISSPTRARASERL